MDDNKYLQLSISAFITALVIGLGWIVADEIIPPDLIPWINGILLGISILIGFFFLYKYKVYYSKTEVWEWVNNLVEKVYEVIPKIAMVPPIIVGVIIVTQNISINNIETSSILIDIRDKLTAHEETLNIIRTDIHNMSSSPTTEVSTTECTTSTPISCVTCCITPTPSDTYTPTPTVSSTQTPTITPTPREITGCVIIHGLNVRNSPGVTESPSNHAKIWLTNGACLTILDTSTPEWARVRIDGWVRLKIEETEYVVTVTPTPPDS